VPYPAKYVDSVTVARDYKANNLPVLRYSDILLMYAEVLNELNKPGVAGDKYYYLNLVRKRAFSSNPSTATVADTLTMEQFRDTVMRERRLEFAQEGQRLFDLKRTGTFISTMTALATKNAAILKQSSLPKYTASYPGGVYPNPSGPVNYSGGTYTFKDDFVKNSKTKAPQEFQVLYPIPYLQLQAYNIGQNPGYN
jgi:hypothetical protein